MLQALGAETAEVRTVEDLEECDGVVLPGGESTDGAVFFASDGKPLTGGRIVVQTNTDTFEFKDE